MDENRCTDCDGILVSQEGQCEYGYGVYMECRNCGQIFDFVPIYGSDMTSDNDSNLDDRLMEYQIGDNNE